MKRNKILYSLLVLPFIFLACKKEDQNFNYYEVFNGTNFEAIPLFYQLSELSPDDIRTTELLDVGDYLLVTAMKDAGGYMNINSPMLYLMNKNQELVDIKSELEFKPVSDGGKLGFNGAIKHKDKVYLYGEFAYDSEGQSYHNIMELDLQTLTLKATPISSDLPIINMGEFEGELIVFFLNFNNSCTAEVLDSSSGLTVNNNPVYMKDFNQVGDSIYGVNDLDRPRIFSKKNTGVYTWDTIFAFSWLNYDYEHFIKVDNRYYASGFSNYAEKDVVFELDPVQEQVRSVESGTDTLESYSNIAAPIIFNVKNQLYISGEVYTNINYNETQHSSSDWYFGTYSIGTNGLTKNTPIQFIQLTSFNGSYFGISVKNVLYKVTL